MASTPSQGHCEVSSRLEILHGVAFGAMQEAAFPVGGRTSNFGLFQTQEPPGFVRNRRVQIVDFAVLRGSGVSKPRGRKGCEISHPEGVALEIVNMNVRGVRFDGGCER